MKMKKIISALLIAVLALGMFLPNASAQAAGEDTGSVIADDSGVVLSKTVSEPDDKGVYTLTLEAYVTGQKVVTQVTKDIPTDIVLVLDQSGSMAQNMNKYKFTAYPANTTNEAYFNARYNQTNTNNQNLYYPLESGGYAPVSVVPQETAFSYTVAPGNYGYRTNNYYYNQRTAPLYHLHSDNTYHQIEVDRESYNYNDYAYTYSCLECSYTYESTGYYTSPDVVYYLKTVDESKTVYTYSYTYNGVTTIIGTSTGADTAPTGFTLYRRQNDGTVQRMTALKSALNAFIEQVETKAKGADGELNTDDDVNHRIAVVGFAYGASSYSNTELFIGATQYGYGNAAEAQYGNVFQDMDTAAGVANVEASVGALSANGATCINLGMDMADGILNANPVDANEERYRVVIAFTDGSPTSSNGFENNVAEAAIRISDDIKADGVTVYSVGIFDGADASSPGDQYGDNTEKCNWFMQELSNNNGTAQTPSYYLSASDADALSGIFHQISSSIESGGATSTLTEETVVQDIISKEFTLPAGADTSSIKVYTADCTGKTGDTMTFGAREAFNAEVTISTDDNTGVTGISVSEFDYSKNWVGTETAANGSVKYRGKKLIIEIPIVVKPDFLGGNQVATNGAASGIYVPDGNGGLKNVAYFDIPKVDVPLKEVSQPTANQYLYLGTAADIGGLVTTVGHFTVNGNPYQVDGINNGYVTLTYYITDNDGTVLGTYTIDPGTKMADVDINAWVPASGVNMNPVLDNDVNTYKAYCTVTAPPSTDPDNPNNFKASSPVTANVYIYKPYVTYQDSALDLGQTANYDDQDISNPVSNYVGVKWMNKNGTELVEATDAMGDAPSLTFTYAPEAGAFTQDTPVQVTAVTLRTAAGTMDALGYTTFYREACTFDGCTNTAKTQVNTTGSSWVNFVVHLNTMDLVINKVIEDGTNPDQDFIFKIDGTKVDMEVVLYAKDFVGGKASVTVRGVPVDTYTVTEDTGWSWRYTPKTNNLTATATNPSVTFENSRPNIYWLDNIASVANRFTGSN